MPDALSGGARPYRRCFSRTTEIVGLVLTPRDAGIVLACFDHQWLTRPQLQQLSGIDGVTRINQRLRQLYDHRYLERIRAGTVGAGLQPIYLAGERAAPLIGEARDLSPAAVRQRLREDSGASAVLLPHDLQVNDVRIALTSALQREPEITWDAWLNARECYDAYAPGVSLRPDGYFRYWRRGALHSFFLEVDRGTVSLSRWRAKVGRYEEYRRDGFYTDRYGLQRFRVLVTVPDAARLAHLREVTAQVAARGFWFTETEALLRDPHPRRALWSPLAPEHEQALVPAAEEPEGSERGKPLESVEAPAG